MDAGDIIAEFDPGEQEYNLIEAAADLEEAQQRLLQAEADGRVALEEARLQAATAEADLRIAVLEMGKNEVLAAILQRQNAPACSLRVPEQSHSGAAE